jgi:Leucine-rich repeat (LRR) protein
MKALQKLSLEKARLNAETCEALKSLGQLKELSLSQCNVADWSFLGHLSRLRSLTANSSLLVSSELNLPAGLRTLELIGGNMADLSWLEALPKLETLVLSTSSRTESLRPLTKLRSLRKLYLGGFPKVSALPDLSGLTKLESVSLGRLSALNGLAPLRKVKTLRKLAVSGMKQLDVQDFQPLVGHPRLKELQLGLGSVRTHRAIYALLGL